MPSTSATVAAETLAQAFARTDLFQDKQWRLSPAPYRLSRGQAAFLERIGEAAAAFYRAVETLYMRGSRGQSLLRNAALSGEWAGRLLDRGKPDWLVQHGRQKKLCGRLPAILRPDLLITQEGFALTELDSVPGGVGLTGFLGRLYAETGDIVGGREGMIAGFAQVLRALNASAGCGAVAIAVSQEASAYRPEFEWLALQVEKMGCPRPIVCAAEALRPTAEGDAVEIPAGNGAVRLKAIYRFFELFDLEGLAAREALLCGEAAGALQITPPMRAFQEEKLSLALFHHPRLKRFWEEALEKRHLETLKAVIPEGWPVEPVEEGLPAQLLLHAPQVDGNPVWDWEPLLNASQKQREYILKLSGFHPQAWGARSVTLGSDVSSQEWRQALTMALEQSRRHPYLLQRFAKPMQVAHPVYTAQGQAQAMRGRVRLCPYYFVEGPTAKLGGVLATVCPADKKIIHGMSVATMVPCAIDS